MTDMERGGLLVPDWISEARDKLVEEVRLYTWSAFEYSIHPSRFVDGWVQGSVRTLNPLGFVGASLALRVPADIVSASLKTDAVREPMGLALLAPVAQYAVFVGIGLFSHLLLRLYGTRPPLRGTLGLCFYSSASLSILAYLESLASLFAMRGALPVLAVAVVNWALFFLPLTRALTALHRVRFTVAVGCLIIATALLGAAQGLLRWMVLGESFFRP